ncbi:MAG TPA: ribonuclease domain-containing protein [Casimicrobiaceae bacterium]|nr:ribonuclease domain-containing protein [Casimicrobiaceae bacterium]
MRLHLPASPWLVIGLVAWCAQEPGAQPRSVQTTLPVVAIADLPREAHATMQLVRAGGPFPYERDGVRFGNRERLLPRKDRDYYREYTVRTPQVRTRGARRLVCGGPKTTPEVCYYTDDHYQSFSRIRE